MMKAMQVTGLESQKAVIEEALRLLVQVKTMQSHNLIAQLLDAPLEPLTESTPFSRTEIYGTR